MQSIHIRKSGEDKGMKTTDEQQFIQEYNRAYGKAIGAERKKRKLSLEKLSSGIMSRTMLEKVEKGTAQWTKIEGDTLMLRMGIPPEYFESLASGEDLERWRKREDICLLVPERLEEAAAAIGDYRRKYKKREPLEEQFLLKAEGILMLERQRTAGREGQRAILDIAVQAVKCTIPDSWEQNLGLFCLSPGELDAVLLVSAALFENGRKEKAWQLWQAVWDYPGQHGWRERAAAMILPQAAGIPPWEVWLPEGGRQGLQRKDRRLWNYCAGMGATAMYCRCWTACANVTLLFLPDRNIWNR